MAGRVSLRRCPGRLLSGGKIQTEVQSQGGLCQATVDGWGAGRHSGGRRNGTVRIQVESKVGVAVRAPGPHEAGTGSIEFAEQDGYLESP